MPTHRQAWVSPPLDDSPFMLFASPLAVGVNICASGVWDVHGFHLFLITAMLAMAMCCMSRSKRRGCCCRAIMTPPLWEREYQALGARVPSLGTRYTKPTRARRISAYAVTLSLPKDRNVAYRVSLPHSCQRIAPRLPKKRGKQRRGKKRMTSCPFLYIICRESVGKSLTLSN